MRKIIFSFTLLVMSFFMTSCADNSATTKINTSNLEKAKTRDAEIKKGVATLTLDKKEYDFGVVDEGYLVETVFKVTNSGNTDLVITNATGSCGCTVPTWPKAPIKPGETGDIMVKFNTNGRPNRQTKTVTLSTNTASGREILTIKGSVTPKAK
ncbi:DUF1573 domain-containing protein [Polaribacter tangerinus]|uniref:DUF1573 domain-containing protein n=1 Tax=Polaribacter tangerinus TaxID=1920034 RepID=UPI000B4A6C95|nr:DUF1573 domain-containing protein [Polaribacter tangerinus]